MVDVTNSLKSKDGMESMSDYEVVDRDYYDKKVVILLFE